MLSSAGKVNTFEVDEDYTQPFTFGDLIGIYFDQIEGILEFEKNGKSLGPI